MRITALFAVLAALMSKAQNPIACYPFTGGSVSDASGNGHDGVLSGALLETDRFGVANNAYRFDGIDDRVELPGLATMDMGDEITVSFWSSSDAPQPDAAIITQPDVYTDRLFMAPHFYDAVFWGHGNVLDVGQCSHSPLDFTSNWQHWAFTHSSADNHMTIYLDGAPLWTVPIHSTIVDGSRPIWIGGGMDAFGDSLQFHGAIDDVSFYNTAMTDAEVAALYASQLGSTTCFPTAIADVAEAQPDALLCGNGRVQWRTPLGGQLKMALVIDAAGRSSAPKAWQEGGTWFMDLAGMAAGCYTLVAGTEQGVIRTRVFLAD